MSGPSDLARFTATIDTANELMLTDEIKMMDVGDGVMRPTNAMVMTNLATLLGGAMPYVSVAAGMEGTATGTNFSVISSADDEYITVYRNEAGSAVYVDSYPNAAATRRAEGLAEAAYDLTFPISLSGEMPWAIVDQFYNAILAVKNNGAVHAVLDNLPGLSMVGEYAWAVADNNGVVLLGIKWSGEVVFYGQATGTPTVYVDGPIGAQDVWALIDSIPYQLTSGGDNFSPSASSGRVMYLNRNGSLTQKAMDMPAPGTIAAFVTTLMHVLSSGQSLSIGFISALMTSQPPTANRLLTIQDGVRLTDQDSTLTSAMVAPFKPLVSKTTEPPLVQTVAQLGRIRGLPGNAGVLASVHGRAGYTINQLSKGTKPYTNSITAVTAAKAEADRLGLGYRVPFVDWIQGEDDRSSAAGVYTTALLTLQSDYDTDIRAISSQPQTVPLLLDQISNWTAYSITESLTPFEQLQIALDNPARFYCAGPKYWLQTTADGIHLPGRESTQLGAMHARAAEAIIKGVTWQPTHAVSAVISGAVVTVKFHTPSGPLVVDTVGVTDPGHWGLRYVDDTASASVQSVKLIGNNTLEFTLSAVPTGQNPYIGIADIGVSGAAGGPATGPRSCLRDSSDDYDGYGLPVFNWACHQRINVQPA